MKRLFSFLSAGLLVLSCSMFQKDDKNKDKNKFLLLAAAVATSANSLSSANCGNVSYSGIACIPDSIAATSKVSTKEIVLDNDLYTKIKDVYEPVRATVKLNRDIVKSISDLIVSLRTVTVTDTAQTGSTNDWGGQKAKYRYAKSTAISGGKRLEVWWNTSSAIYGTKKAFEINFKEDGSNVTGYLWARTLNSDNATLATVYVKFTADTSTGKKTTAVAMKGFYSGYTKLPENGFYYIKEENNLASLDGGFTLTNYNPSITGVTALSRAYLFTAAGSASRGAVKIAFPRIDSTDVTVWDNGSVANLPEVWTDWILYSLSAQSQLTSIKSLSSSCSSLTAPSTDNPVTNSGSTAAEFKTCIDALYKAYPANTGIKDIVYITRILNPAFYSVSGTNVFLDATETARDTTWDTVTAKLQSKVRNGDPGDGYSANFTAASLATMDFTAGTGLPSEAKWSTDDTASF